MPRWLDKLAYRAGERIGREMIAGQRLQLEEWRQSSIDRRAGIPQGMSLQDQAYYDGVFDQDMQDHNVEVWLRNDRIQSGDECIYGHPFCHDPRCRR